MISACNRKMLVQFRYRIEIFDWLYFFGKYSLLKKSANISFLTKITLFGSYFAKREFTFGKCHKIS